MVMYTLIYLYMRQSKQQFTWSHLTACDVATNYARRLPVDADRQDGLEMRRKSWRPQEGIVVEFEVSLNVGIWHWKFRQVCA